MRDEAEDTLNAFEHHWGKFSRREIVARAFDIGLIAGWNCRNGNDSDLMQKFGDRMRVEMTSGKENKS